MTKLISIITINFNNKLGLVKTVNSVIGQTFSDFEYLLIDGGSTDGSVEIIEKNKNNFFYSISERDSGIYDAMNKGIKASTGKFLLFLNSGDYLASPEVLQKVVDNLQNADIVYGDIYQNVNGRLVETIYPSKITAKFFFPHSLPHSASFMHRSLFDKYGLYNTSNKIVSDWEFFFLAVCKYNCIIKHISVFVSVYDLTGVSHTSGGLPSQEKRQVIEKHFTYFKDDYLTFLKFERNIKAPFRLVKRINRLFLRLFNINRVYIKDI